jgi:hypothetical protein
VSAVEELEILRTRAAERDGLDAAILETEKRAKAEQLQIRRDLAAIEQAYAHARSVHEKVLEGAFETTQLYIAAKADLSRSRDEAVAAEREMRRHSLPIAESVASFESRWFQTERWSTFHASAKQIFGGKLL